MQRRRTHGLGRVALETVDVDRCIAVATGAELIGTVDRYIFSLVVLDRVAVDTLFQRILAGADAFVHGFVALMKYVRHMVPAHFRDRSYTFLGGAEAPFGLGKRKLRERQCFLVATVIVVCCCRLRQQQQQR